MTSEGKLRGIEPVLAHKALSLVHVQDGGHRGVRLRLSTATISRQTSQRKARSRPETPVQRPILLGDPCVSSIPEHETDFLYRAIKKRRCE